MVAIGVMGDIGREVRDDRIGCESASKLTPAIYIAQVSEIS